MPAAPTWDVDLVGLGRVQLHVFDGQGLAIVVQDGGFHRQSLLPRVRRCAVAPPYRGAVTLSIPHVGRCGPRRQPFVARECCYAHNRAMAAYKPNTLYYGDNLTVLRDFPPECVDLVYLDPPFNSNRSYNVLFKEARGTESEAQIQAFEDTWHWGVEGVTAATYDEVVRRGDEVGRMLQAFVDALGHNDVTAYLTMMAPRLIELRRVLKPTGSIYLHCDPTASHYLKALMDAVFGAVNFKNEIVWKRANAHNDPKRFGRISDTILYYGKSQNATWVTQHTPYREEY